MCGKLQCMKGASNVLKPFKATHINAIRYRDRVHFCKSVTTLDENRDLVPDGVQCGHGKVSFGVTKFV